MGREKGTSRARDPKGSTLADVSGRRLGRNRQAVLFDDLLRKHPDETVDLYGDAVAQALEEYDGDVDALLETVDPLATVDLSVIDQPGTADLADPLDLENRLEALRDPEPMDPEIPETIDAIERVLESNTTIITREAPQ